MLSRLVSAGDLERLLARLKETAPVGEQGLFGPESLSWKINRESALFLAAGRAALLQLAHPWVAAAIAQHSRTLTDPIGRFHHTFRVIFAMIFGRTEQAIAASRNLHRLHDRIRGTLPDAAGRFAQGSEYEANEVSALRWVYATLVDSALRAYELLLPPLSDAEREQYLQESLKMGALFGIEPEFLPRTSSDFRAYVEAALQSETLGITAATRNFAGQLQKGAGLLLPPPFWYQALTVELLPARLRAEFHFSYGDRECAAAQRALGWLRRVYPRLPTIVRFVGPYNEAQGRLLGKGPNAAVRLSNRMWVGQPVLLDR